MQAFHNDQAVKDFYIQRLEAHYAADEIIQGTYWEGGKGCAIGCTIHGHTHQNYETILGIPASLAYLEDYMFEAMDNADAKKWPLRFLRAIPVGADLSLVSRRLVLWLLTDTLQTYKSVSPEHVVDVIHTCIEIYEAMTNTSNDIVDTRLPVLGSSICDIKQSYGLSWIRTLLNMLYEATFIHDDGSTKHTTEYFVSLALRYAGIPRRHTVLRVADKLEQLLREAPQTPLSC